MRSQRKIFAVMLSLSLMTAGAGLTSVTENHLFSENSLTVHAADGYVDFDEATGTLTLHGNITSNIITDVPVITDYQEDTIDVDGHPYKVYTEISKYNLDKRNVRKIIAAPDAVLPENCSSLLSTYSKYTISSLPQYQLPDAEKPKASYEDRNYYRWKNLELIDLSAADMSKVKKVNNMFEGSSNITIKMNNGNLSNVTSLNGILHNCSEGINLDLSGATFSSSGLKEVFSNCIGLKSINLSKSNTSNITDMSSMFSGCSSLTSIKMTGMNTSNVTDMSSMFSGCSSLTSINMTGINTSNVTDMHSMFSGCSSFTSINMTGINTSNVTDMSELFKDCSSLNLLNISEFDTFKVEKMNSMFENCSALNKLDLDKFNTYYVSNMSRMFAGCTNLSTLKISGFDTHNVVSMSNMFDGCSALNSIDTGSFNTEKVTSMDQMFNNCKLLSSLDLRNFKTSSLTTTDSMFSGCSVITNIDLGSFDTKKLTSAKKMFYDCSQLKTVRVSDLWDISKLSSSATQDMFKYCKNINGERNTKYNDNYVNGTYARIDKAGAPGYFTHTEGTTDGYVYLNEDTGELALYGHVTKAMIDEYKSNNAVKSVTAAKGCILPSDCSFMFNRNSNYYWKNVSRIDLTNADASNAKNTNHMFNAMSASSIDISKLNFSNVENMSGMFYGCGSLKILDVTSIDTSNVTDMSSMFYGCESLNMLDITSIDTSNVTDMSSMFEACKSLSSLDLTSFNTQNVTNMSGMFKYCISLASITGLSNFDTSSVTDMSYMFNFCMCLSHHYLTISSFDTSNVTNMCYMFSYCRSLYSIDISSFDTSNVTNMSHLFADCSSLSSIDCSSFDTSNVTDMYGMFMECSKFSSTDFIKHFDTSKVTDLGGFFSEWKNLSSIDLSIFDTSSLTDISGMFAGCTSLKSIDFTVFDTSKVTSMSGLFLGCSAELINSIDFSTLNTSNVTNMSFMFSSIDESELEIHNLDTSNVTNMKGLFYDCSSLKKIDLSSFDTSEVTDMGQMFSNCTSLKTIYITDKWSTEKVKSSTYMFDNCKSLTGSNGTVFNFGKTDKEYAREDKPFLPGYLSTINYTDFSICGEPVSLLNQNDILGDGVFRFDPVSWTLYINGDCTSEKSIINYFRTDKELTIRLSGDSKLVSVSDVIYSHTRNLIIDGNYYHLTAVSKKGNAITGTLTLNNTFLSVEAAGVALTGCTSSASDPKVLKINNSNVDLKGGDQAVKTYLKGIELNNCKVNSPESYYFDNMGNMRTGSGYVKVFSVKQDIALPDVRLVLAKDGTFTIEIQFLSDDVNAAINGSKIPLKKRNDTYILTYSVAPKDYNKPLNLTFTDVSKNDRSFTLADMITTYKKYYINNTEAIDLINSLETYCKTAEEYFKNTASETGTPSVTEYNFIGYNKTDKKYNSSPVTGKTEHIKYAGTSLLLKDKTILRHYFRLENGMTPNDLMETYMEGSVSFELYLDNKLISYPDFNDRQNSSYIYVDVTEIGPAYLDNMYTLKITEDDSTMEFTSGVLSYCNKVIDTQTSDPALQNVCKALYSYNYCAKKYLESLK